ncbi:Dehydrodolichyl diphosphate synthase [Echinococcus granulosus]|uniref:ditrans,polycis-polyprenyl diphosphate synthase [(2E,6E)-farnesyldiphosphate specific] n=1 Tax=Echinococcus granulosus TaxID=6210 RepID=W6UBD2_ECHGR|nr:Dehydrodolichyl diphosphate synthase [Echinococcus granulosus]EUB55752.1 Dehydrodolichyl diphosphate synthase [Echinococcus granulosus]
MPWINQEYKYSCFQKLAMSVLKQGVIPSHVSFIMDGNRRHATAQGLQKTEGHKQGFSKLSEVSAVVIFITKVLRWCYDFGIKEVSVYAFSIENFKRSEREVSFLMDLALVKLNDLVQKKATLNILMPYTTRDEITSALNAIRRGVQAGILEEEDISPEVIDRSSQLRGCRPLDLLVRTSGEVRLSDFMLWQASRSAALFSFFEVNWPTFSFWHLTIAILHFQLNRVALLPLPEAVRCHLSGLDPHNTVNGHSGIHQPVTIDVVEEENRKRRLEKFYAKLEKEYMDELFEMASLPEADETAA